MALVCGSLLCGAAARAQAPADLAAGRQLFVEALADEEHGRFADAVAKYKRVLSLRDTPNIRYRIGSSLEHMGKLVQAIESFTVAVRIGTAAGTPADAEVARAAQARIDALAPKVAHVALRLPAPAPAGADVTVDGEPVAPRSLADLPLDPGTHIVTATAPGAQPFRSSVDVTEGARVEVPLLLAPAADASPPGTPPQPVTHPYRSAGVVTAAVGAVLLVSGGLVLALRSSAIGDLERGCPSGACPASQRDDLQSKHDRAQTEGPLGGVLVATGIAAAAVGVVLIVLPGKDTRSETRLAPAPATHGGMLTLVRRF